MRNGLRNNEKKKEKNIPEKIVFKELSNIKVEEKKYELNNNKILIVKDFKQKNNKINEKDKKDIYLYKNKIYSKNDQINLDNNKNENFLGNKCMKYKNVNKKNSPNETDFNKLQKKVYISNFEIPKNHENFENFSNSENFCLKKKKKLRIGHLII